jgi:3-oxoacyl-[acyl-carrier-protein] synthase-3
MTPRRRGGEITGVGVALPDKTVTNADLVARMDTTEEWIVDRTGIHERRIGGTTAGLATEAGVQALARAGLEPADIDLLVLATTTPDRTVPATSATVAAKLGLRCGAMDVNAACTGFVYGLVAATGVLGLGGAVRRVLLVGAETLSRITDWDDRGTAILFADGAGAAVVEASEGPGQLLGWDLGADGTAESILYADHGDVIRMEGREVFRGRRGSWSTRRCARWPWPASRPPTWIWSFPTRPTSGSSRRPTSASASRWNAPPSSSTAPATRRRPRSPPPWPMPSRTTACTTA